MTGCDSCGRAGMPVQKLPYSLAVKLQMHPQQKFCAECVARLKKDAA